MLVKVYNDPSIMPFQREGEIKKRFCGGEDKEFSYDDGDECGLFSFDLVDLTLISLFSFLCPSFVGMTEVCDAERAELAAETKKRKEEERAARAAKRESKKSNPAQKEEL